MNQTHDLYEKFVQEMLTTLRLMLPDDGSCTVSIMPVTKNNKVDSDTITIRGEGRCCAPVIHLDEIFGYYLNGMTVEELAGQIVDIYHDSEDKFEDLASDLLFDFDYVKDCIILKLINYERNKDLLENVPHIRKLDLAITFRLFSVTNDMMSGSVLIDQDLFDIWGCSVEELFAIASKNMNRMWEPVMGPLDRMMEGLPEAERDRDEEGSSTPLIILTNKKFCLGSVALFSTDQVRQLAERTGRDYYVLPSSIHEVLLVPADEEVSPEYLGSLVRTVNEEVVADEDYLSDHIYFYDRLAETLTIAE